VQYAGSDPDLATLAQGELARLRTLNQTPPQAGGPPLAKPK
jgi:hypothetical protein